LAKDARKLQAKKGKINKVNVVPDSLSRVHIGELGAVAKSDQKYFLTHFFCEPFKIAKAD